MLNTTKSPLDALLSIPEALKARRIRFIDSEGEARWFGIKRIDSLIRYFDAEPSANSVTYDAVFSFSDHKPMLGSFTITRNGDLICQFAH